MKNLKLLILTIFFLPIISLSATNDFVASSDITVADVTFGQTTVDMIILSGSTAEEISFDSGAFTVINPGTFKVGSSDSNVKSIQISLSGAVVTCTENTTAGTTYATLPTTSGTYTIRPSTTTDCTDLCTVISHTSTYNTFPTCGSATCNSGYHISGSGASATCVRTDAGGGVLGSVSALNLPTPRPQIIYPDGTIVYLDEEEEDGQGEALSVSASLNEAVQSSTYQPSSAADRFLNNLYKGLKNKEVTNLQQLLRELKLFNYESNTGYYGTVTEEAVKAFQCKYNIICKGNPSSTGYGVVGPKTREKLNWIASSQAREDGGEATVSADDSATAQQLNQILMNSLEQQINELQEMVNALIKELEEMII